MRVGNSNKEIQGKSANEQERTSVVDSDELMLLEEVFELRPDMRSCHQHEDTGKGQET